MNEGVMQDLRGDIQKRAETLNKRKMMLEEHKASVIQRVSETLSILDDYDIQTMNEEQYYKFLLTIANWRYDNDISTESAYFAYFKLLWAEVVKMRKNWEQKKASIANISLDTWSDSWCENSSNFILPPQEPTLQEQLPPPPPPPQEQHSLKESRYSDGLNLLYTQWIGEKTTVEAAYDKSEYDLIMSYIGILYENYFDEFEPWHQNILYKVYQQLEVRKKNKSPFLMRATLQQKRIHLYREVRDLFFIIWNWQLIKNSY
jgi:hypothetical protein